MKSGKKKTSYTMSVVLTEQIDEVRHTLGVSRSDFVSLSVAFFLAHLSPLAAVPMKRRIFLRRLLDNFQEIITKEVERL